MHAGFGKSDIPVLNVTAKELQILAPFGQGKIVGNTLVVPEEILFDGVSAVAEAQNKVLVTEVGIVFHHVPKHRSVADRHHRFGNIVGVLPQAHSKPPAKDNNFHFRCSFLSELVRRIFQENSRPRTGLVELVLISQ